MKPESLPFNSAVRYWRLNMDNYCAECPKLKECKEKENGRKPENDKDN